MVHLFSRFGVIWAFTLIVVSCSSVQQSNTIHRFSRYENKGKDVSASFGVDSAIYLWIKPYRDSLQAVMNEKIGKAQDNLVRQKPESSLGNVIAESVRERASLLLKKHVDVGLVNLGGLRTDIGKGDITIGAVYELMPFENSMIILTVSGYELLLILNDLAQIGGEPVSGVRFRIQNGMATDIVVSGQPIDINKSYLVATNDYLVYGGGSIPTLWKIKEKQETTILIRDLIVDYIKNRKTLEARLDGRIRL
jgi:2',3'-cyclic-nucleotide 2'-phosphodiesterase (5'-nucleotidase family)